MSTRSINNQAMTVDPNKLVIGIMRVRIGATTNVSSASAAGFQAGDNLGALKSASMSIAPTTKTHTSGYPKQVDLVIDEAVEGTLKVEMEEVMSAKCLGFVDSILGSISTGVTSYYCAEALALFATGSQLSLFSNYCYLKPQLTMNFGNDFNVAPFEFELLYNPAYTNNKLLYRTFTAATSGRDIQYQAVTQDAAKLQIGFFQCRVGRTTPRPLWVAKVQDTVSTGLTGGTTVAPDKVVSASAVTATVQCQSASGYLGPHRGRYRLWFDGANIQYLNPEQVDDADAGGSPTPTQVTPAASINLADGSNLKVNFSAYASLVTNDKWEWVVDPTYFRGKGFKAAGAAYGGTFTATGTYSGAKDGAFIITATGANAYSVVRPDGTTATVAAMVLNTPDSLGQGVSATFSATLTADQKFVIPCYSGAAQDDTKTSILSPYSILSRFDSVGAVQNTSFSVSSTMKDHTSGSPAKKDATILESSDVTVEVTLEEVKVSTSALVAGAATTLFDAILDGAINQTKYFAPVELVAELATGGTPLRFWFPSCQVVPNFEMAPGDDWSGTPFQLKAVRQTGLTNAPPIVQRLTY
jgi:hypothetical protein